MGDVEGVEGGPAGGVEGGPTRCAGLRRVYSQKLEDELLAVARRVGRDGRPYQAHLILLALDGNGVALAQYSGQRIARGSRMQPEPQRTDHAEDRVEVGAARTGQRLVETLA